MTERERERYARHLVLPDIGEEGQRRLKAARVMIVGLGGLGCPAASYLAAAGVGHLTLIDGDTVERTNLQRQVLYGERDLGKPKAEVAASRLRDLNPDIRIDAIVTHLDAERAATLVPQHDIIVDGTDNFETRYVLNHAAVDAARALVHASILRHQGQLILLHAAGADQEPGPCLSCVFPSPPDAARVPNCAEAGVLGALAGIMGSLQANVVVQQIVGPPTPRRALTDLILVDAHALTIERIPVSRRKDCTVCGTERMPNASARPATPTTPASSARPATPTSQGAPIPIIPGDQARALRNDPERRALFVDVRTAEERATAGTIDDAVARPEWVERPAADELRRDIARLMPDWEQQPEAIPIVVYCESGVRSSAVVQHLRMLGFTGAMSLGGGHRAWRTATKLANA